jgi:phage terminase large subunit
MASLAPFQAGPTWGVIASREIVPEMKTYTPHGAVAEMMYCRDPEVVIDGPAGTGKSLGALHKLYACMMKWPGARGAIARKYRRTLTDSALVTWEEEVLGRGHPALDGPKREQRHMYTLPNGSTITAVGLDEAEKQKSSQYDFVYLQEATEIKEQDLFQIIRGMRNGVMPFQQILMDCNPDAPWHWIKMRFERGDMTRFQSVHKDNPALYDREVEMWTDFGKQYMAGLDRLLGVTRLRLKDGLWVAAEGAVYDVFDPARDVVAPFVIPDEWPRRVGLDFGAVNTVALFYAIDIETGLYYLYREYRGENRTAADHVTYLRFNEPRDLWVVGGSGSESQWRRDFSAAGLLVREPPKVPVSLGITRVYGQHKRGTIKVFDTCTEYLREKTEYAYKPEMLGSTEAIENKEAFHRMDAERYILSYDFPEVARIRSEDMISQLPAVTIR